LYGTEGSGHEALTIGLTSWAEHYESYQKAHRGLRASLEVRVGMLARAQIKDPREQVLHFVNDYPESFTGKLTFVAEKPPPSHVFEQAALVEAEGSREYF